MNRFTLDTIGEIGFGTDIGSLDDPSSPFLASFDHAQKASFYRFVLPGPIWRLLRLLGVGSERGSTLHFRLLDDYSREAPRNHSRTCQNCRILEEFQVARDLSASLEISGGFAGASFVGLFLQLRHSSSLVNTAASWDFDADALKGLSQKESSKDPRRSRRTRRPSEVKPIG
eukprot:g31355.t1